jgi:ribulose-bisphosphate carboxylase large chain
VSGEQREFVRATYRILVEADRVAARAQAIHLEQTVELPREAVRDAYVEREILARVESIQADPDEGFRATVAYPVATTAWDPAQLLNLLFGNTSLQPEVELVDVELAPSLIDVLGGPRFGIEAWRKATGVADRALTCTALKPMGLGPEALADLARTFARAGLDLIKDDHGLADHPFCRFEDRVRACQSAVDAVTAETGHRALYVPNLTGTPETLYRQLDLAADVGVRAAMLSPMLVGLPLFCELVRSRSPLPLVAHPALAGAQRIAPPVLLGTLFRAFGADAATSRSDCAGPSTRCVPRSRSRPAACRSSACRSCSPSMESIRCS